MNFHAYFEFIVSQNCPSRVVTKAICENYENTSENVSLNLRGVNAIQHGGQIFRKTFYARQNTISRPSE